MNKNPPMALDYLQMKGNFIDRALFNLPLSQMAQVLYH